MLCTETKEEVRKWAISRSEQITGEKCPTSPVSAKTYTAAGLPWFSLYDEHLKDVAPSKELAKVKSVAQKDSEHGFTKLMENEHVDAQQVKKLHVPSTPVEKDVVPEGNW